MCLKPKLYLRTHLYNSYKIKLPCRSFSLTGDTKSSNGSNSLVPGVAVGSFFAGAVVTLLICLLVVFVKRRKKRKSQVSDLTVREQPSAESQVENQENFSNGRPPKDKSPLRDGITNICIPLTCV